jgi:exo-beta-1,3-glucanase (GH17 family)
MKLPWENMTGDARWFGRGMTTNRPACDHCLSKQIICSFYLTCRFAGKAMHQIIVHLSVLLSLFGATGIALADGGPLPGAMQHTRFISYTPRSFSIANGKVVAASENGIRADLKLLRQFFNGLITYASTNGVEAVPAVAHEMNYRSVIMGIWDPSSETEIQNVIRAARRYPSMVSAVIVGNEGLYSKRYQLLDVQKTMQRLKKECPLLAVTTSEPFFLYFKKDYTDFFNAHDLLMPNVHPIFEPWFRPGEPSFGVNMVLNVVGQFREAYRRPLLIKETGVPSGPATDQSGFTPERQAQFWSELFSRFPASSEVALAGFEAFDAPWKPATIGPEFPGDHAEEAFWGFFETEGTAKPVVRILPKLVEADR